MASGKKRKLRLRNPPRDTHEDIEQKINQRKFLQEREFTKTDDFEFYQKVKARGLGKLLGKRRPGNEVFVRQFYFQYTCFEKEVCLRDKTICLGPNLIKRFYRLPSVDEADCVYQRLKQDRNDFPFKEIAAELVIEGRDAWFSPYRHEQYLAKADLTPEAKCWLHLVAHNICPTSHTTRLTRSMSLLIFLLKLGQPVKLESIIFEAIDTCSANHSHQLIFPHLISDLLFQAKVPQLASDPVFQPLPPFAYHHVLSHKNPEVRLKMKSKRGAAQSQASLLTTLSEKVDRIEAKVDKITDMLSRIATFRGSPMDTAAPEPSNPTRTLAVYTGHQADRANEEISEPDGDDEVSDFGDADDQSVEEVSASEDESMGDAGASSSRLTVDDTSDIEYIPSDEED